MSKLSPILLGLVIFIFYNAFGRFLQTDYIYIDGFFIKVLFTAVLGLMYLKIFKQDLTYKSSLAAAFTAYAGQTVIRILNTLEQGWSMPKLIITSSVVELLTLGTVFVTLVALYTFVSPGKKHNRS